MQSKTFYPEPLDTPPPKAALVLHNAIAFAERELDAPPIVLLVYRALILEYRLRTGAWPTLAGERVV